MCFSYDKSYVLMESKPKLCDMQKVTRKWHEHNRTVDVCQQNIEMGNIGP